MRTVRDESGDRYLLVKQSAESSLVRDPTTGEQRYVDNDALAPVDDVSPLETAADGVPAAVRRVVAATHDDRSLGLLAEIADRGPIGVRDLLDAYDLCESDLHGLLAEFRAAGLIEEARIGGERGYAATETATDALAVLRAEAT